MNRKLLVLALACFFVLTVLVAGCGGEESGGGSRDSPPKGKKTQETNKAGQTGTQTKIAIGKVAKVRTGTENMSLVVRLTTRGQDPQREIFAVAKSTKITLNDRDATLEDAQKGQQAQIKYSVKYDRNRAQEIVLFGMEGSSGSATTN